MKKGFVTVLTLASIVVLSACANDPYRDRSMAQNTGTGAVVGAAVGAGIGALANKNDRKKGALIGAAAGGVAGAGAGALSTNRQY